MIQSYEYNGFDDAIGLAITYFKIVGSHGAIYDVRVGYRAFEAQINPSNCTCDFGSFYGHSEKNKQDKKVCKHLLEAIDLLIYLKQIKTWSYI